MTACTACGSSRLRTFFELRDVPVQSCVMLTSREAARAYPRGDLGIAVCESCGFILNTLYDEGQQGEIDEYESSQGHSAKFANFLTDQCTGLIERHGLEGRNVIEIGCGGGDFLRRLCELGGCRGVGFDPTYAGPDTSQGGRVRFVRGRYGPEHFALAADLIACRHTLEHLPRPAEFLGTVRAGASRQPSCEVFFEVPDTQRILDEGAFWDIYYEHCNYFTAGSLARLFDRCGFEITRLERVYDDQYLTISARCARSGGAERDLRQFDDLGTVLEGVERFASTVSAQLTAWRHAIDVWAERGANVALWGAGSKAAGFLAGIGDAPVITAIVDINPRKQGLYQAGSGQPIVSPASLADDPPDIMVVMNPIYRQEIAQGLANAGLHPEIRVLEPACASR